MKKIIIVLVLFSFIKSYTQNKKILYGFDKIPQGLLLNPGAEPTYKYHIGIPFLSGLSAEVNITEITIADIFRDNSIGIFKSIDFNQKFQNALKKINKDDYTYLNAQIEILSGGYKINRRDYVSAGFYTEMEAFMNMPKDIFTLINEGNTAYLNKNFSLSQVNVKANVLGVLHIGLSRRFNNKFTAGARLKLYSGSTNITSTGNSGTFTTNNDNKNIYKHILNGADASVNTSGIYEANDKRNISASITKAFSRTFLSGNFGVGIDLGLTYHLTKQIEVTASIVDLGFISYTKRNTNRTLKGDYTFSGIDFKYDNINTDYWKKLDIDFNKKVKRKENEDPYSVMRPLKFYSSYAYSYGKSRNISNCHDISYKDFYDSTVGGQLYAIFLPTGPKFAFTGFYQYKLSKSINTKATYTIDDFSYTNFGVGVSLNVWKINLYGMVDNILKITDVADANTASFQFGINYIIN